MFNSCLGLGLSHSGMLHTWYVNISRSLLETKLNLIVLRPTCPSGYYLLTPGTLVGIFIVPVQVHFAHTRTHTHTHTHTHARTHTHTHTHKDLSCVLRPLN